MADNSPISPIHQSPGQQPSGSSHPQIETSGSNTPLSKKPSILQEFRDAFTTQKRADDEPYALYRMYKPRAESIKITIQMLIGLLIGLALLLKVFANILQIFGNPSLAPLATLKPLEVVAYGLFFSTGIDLAFMLYTSGQMRL